MRGFNQRGGVVLECIQTSRDVGACAVGDAGPREVNDVPHSSPPSPSVLLSFHDRRLACSLFPRLPVPAAAAAGTPTRSMRSKPTPSMPLAEQNSKNEFLLFLAGFISSFIYR